MDNINNLIRMAETTYQAINNHITEGTTPLIDKVCPNHDGKLDPDVCADMMHLFYTLNSLSKACLTGADHLKLVLDID